MNNAFRHMKKWWAAKKYQWAVGVIKSHGFSVVRMVHKAGTDYIVGNDGRMFRIGREKK